LSNLNIFVLVVIGAAVAAAAAGTLPVLLRPAVNDITLSAVVSDDIENRLAFYSNVPTNFQAD
jgi:hypothetical protein